MFEKFLYDLSLLFAVSILAIPFVFLMKFVGKLYSSYKWEKRKDREELIRFLARDEMEDVFRRQRNCEEGIK